MTLDNLQQLLRNYWGSYVAAFLVGLLIWGWMYEKLRAPRRSRRIVLTYFQAWVALAPVFWIPAVWANAGSYESGAWAVAGLIFVLDLTPAIFIVIHWQAEMKRQEDELRRERARADRDREIYNLIKRARS